MDSPIIEMVMQQGWAAQIILIVLVLISVVGWAIIFNRIGYLGQIKANTIRFSAKYDKCKTLAEVDAFDKKLLTSPSGQIGYQGAMEYKRIVTDAQSMGKMKDWSFFLQNQFGMATERLESAYLSTVAVFDSGVFILAMISSIAPFIGLLGTVWGIMNSFFEIGKQGSASLPVVAPGIAEALIATLAGLAVAIPALFFYNYFMHRIERLENELEAFKDLVLVRLKREILQALYSDHGAA